MATEERRQALASIIRAGRQVIRRSLPRAPMKIPISSSCRLEPPADSRSCATTLVKPAWVMTPHKIIAHPVGPPESLQILAHQGGAILYGVNISIPTTRVRWDLPVRRHRASLGAPRAASMTMTGTPVHVSVSSRPRHRPARADTRNLASTTPGGGPATESGGARFSLEPSRSSGYLTALLRASGPALREGTARRPRSFWNSDFRRGQPTWSLQSTSFP